MLFNGDYGFFEYKYNIPGYTGQDFSLGPQVLYLCVSLAFFIILLTMLKGSSEQRARRIVGVIGIFLTVFYVAKTAWETHYDVARFGGFNTGLLPLDMCSIIMPAAILAGFARGRIQRLAAAWVSVGGIVGGVATMVHLNAFMYYPFRSFGALYSMLWHFLMVFAGVLLLMTARPPLRFTLLRDAFLFHVLFSLIVIPIDYACGFDFMFYREMSSVPFFSGVAETMIANGLGFLVPPLMLVLYFAAFCLVWSVAALFKNRAKRRERTA